MRTKTLRRLGGAALLLALLAPAAAQAAAPGLKIRGVSVMNKTLAKAIERTDAQGHRRAFSQVAVVEIEGDFPPPMDRAFDLFIGDARIREYGASPKGIYFKVYDPALLERFKGQEIRYRAGSGKILSTGARFVFAPQAPR